MLELIGQYIQIDLDSLLNDEYEVKQILYNETDIGCVLISLNYLELCVQYLINSKLIEDSTEIKKVFDIITGLLGIYANKIKFAKRLELIENDIFNDLKTMGEIRNLFAHSHKSLSFNDNKIIDKCDKLISCKKSLPPDVINSTNNSIDVMYQNTKQKFIHSFFNIANDFLTRCLIKRMLDKKNLT